MLLHMLSEFQFFIFQAHSLSTRMKHRLGLPCFKAKILRISSPSAVCFGVGRPGCLMSVPTRALPLTQMNPEFVPWIMSRLAVNAALEDGVNYRIPVNVKLCFSAESAVAKFVMYMLCSVPWPPRTGGGMEGLRGAQVNFISRDLTMTVGHYWWSVWSPGTGKTSSVLWFSPSFLLLQLKKKLWKKFPEFIKPWPIGNSGIACWEPPSRPLFPPQS